MNNNVTEKKPKVMIGLPTMGSLHTLLVSIILKWMSDAMNSGSYGLSVYPTMSVQPVDNARNHIVEEFLKSDCTHLLFVDSDTLPPYNALQKLLLQNKDIISGLTPIIEHDENRKNDSNGYYRKLNVVGLNDKFVEPYLGTIEVKGAGSSCILIKREVFEKMQKPYYRFQYQDDNGKYVVIGEDILFTIKAKELGFKIWADTSLICKHEKTIPWSLAFFYLLLHASLFLGIMS